jgi:hypothetical protein
VPNIGNYGKYSVSTLDDLQGLPGVKVKWPTPGGGPFHGTVIIPDPPPPGLFVAISSKFQQVQNPYKTP